MTTEEKKDDCACGGLDAVYASIDALVDFARKRLELDPRDADWTRNRIFELFSLDSYRPTGATSDDTLPDDLLTRFRAAAVAAGLFDADEGPVYADIVMGMLSGTPSAVQDRFEAVEREHGGMEAMRWFYDYCVANNYVKKGVLALRLPRPGHHHQPRQARIQEHEEGRRGQLGGRRIPRMHDLP